MFMTDFEDSTVLRFAKLELVRNNWRRFTFDFDTTGRYVPIEINGPTAFNVSAVNIEENDRRVPIPYVIPPGIERVQALSNGGINILQNEQSLSMQLCNLQLGDTRGVFKNINLDLRQFGKLSMFVHAESVQGQAPLKAGDLDVTVRVGSDFINNFYEVRYPLQITPFGATTEDVIWPNENSLDFEMSILVKLKATRNLLNYSRTQVFRQTINGKTYSLLGDPNLGEVRGILIGVENAQGAGGSGGPVCTEVWINELRLSGMDEQNAWAAVGQVNMQLADLGTFSFAVNMHTQ
jgi:cell surface protein SprA